MKLYQSVLKKMQYYSLSFKTKRTPLLKHYQYMLQNIMLFSLKTNRTPLLKNDPCMFRNIILFSFKTKRTPLLKNDPSIFKKIVLFSFKTKLTPRMKLLTLGGGMSYPYRKSQTPSSLEECQVSGQHVKEQ